MDMNKNVYFNPNEANIFVCAYERLAVLNQMFC